MIEWLYVRFIMLYDNEFDNKIWIFCWKQWEACLELVGCILLCRCINYKSPICPQPLLLNLAIQTIPLKASTNTLSQDPETLEICRETKFLTTQGLMPHIVISKWFWILNWSSLQRSFWWIETDWGLGQRDAPRDKIKV